MSAEAVRVVNLSKRFRIGENQGGYQTLRDKLTDAAKSLFRRSESTRKSAMIWALQDVSFDVKQGEVIGIIGRNGAGKSTLLKVLSRITEPTAGYAEIKGRLSSLLEVGTGFHAELTGRENIYLNAAILGMKRKDIGLRFDEIVAFSEVEKFIDTPVKHYSSGMYLRLAFAVAAHLEPDVLLIDEVLAVGDAAFQRKCLGKMGEVAQQGRTVLFVSHDMTAISRLASKTVVLDGGRVVYLGETGDAIGVYIKEHQSSEENLELRTDRRGDGVIRLKSFSSFDAGGRKVTSVGTGDPVYFSVGYTTKLKSLEPMDFVLDVRFTDVMGHPIATLSTRFSPPAPRGKVETDGFIVCRVESLALAAEVYGIDLWLSYRGGVSDFVPRAAELQIVTADYFGTGAEPLIRKNGAALLRHEWFVGDRAVECMPRPADVGSQALPGGE
jgi:lipopolysaccharide transport system ATP-binding protein